MPSHHRPSPRAAIQDWLSRTEEKSKAEEHLSPSKTERRDREGHRQQRHRHEGDGLLQPGSGRQTTEGRVCSGVSMEAGNSRLPAFVGHDNRNFAQRLGLRTPFRAFGTNHNHKEVKEDMGISVPKRKRSLSSTSSYLRGRAGQIIREAGDREYPKHLKPVVHTARLNKNISESPSHVRRSSLGAANLLKKHAKPYERQARHRTREDHYTLKETKTAKRQKIDEGEHSPKMKGKRKRRGKSGSALMHDFAAKNIAHNRLTLRSAPVVGIFSKGRASSPIKRMGLPDLAFSEVAFLKSHRENPENFQETLEKNSRRRMGRFADEEAEISRYFTSAKAPLPHRQAPEVESSVPYKQRCFGSETNGVQMPKERHSVQSNALRPLIELPKTPFLGFGSSGLSMSSPMKVQKPLNTPIRTQHSPEHHIPPTRSTAYYTWSRSRAPSQNSLPFQAACSTPSTPGLGHGYGYKHELAGHAFGHQEMRREFSSAVNDAPHGRQTFASQAEKQDRNLEANGKSSPNVQPNCARLKEQTKGRGKVHDGNSSENTYNQGLLTNSTTKISLPGRAPNAKSKAPPSSSLPQLNNTESFKSFDAALNKLIQQCMEAPPRRTENSLYTTVAHSGAANQDPSRINSGSLSKAQAVEHDKPGFEVLSGYTHPKSPAFNIEPSIPPSAPTYQVPQGLSEQAKRLLDPSSSKAIRGQTPESSGCGVRNPMLRAQGIRRSEIPAKNAWYVHDGMYERQEDNKHRLSGGSVDYMRMYTPVETLYSEEFTALKERLPDPVHNTDSSTYREKFDFQHKEDNISGSAEPLDECSANLRGLSYQNTNSSSSHNLFANFDKGSCQIFDQYSPDEQFALGSDMRLGETEKYPSTADFDTRWHRAKQNNPGYEPDGGQITRSWNYAAPSPITGSLYGFAKNNREVHPNLDEEGHLVGFWKPHLLY